MDKRILFREHTGEYSVCSGYKALLQPYILGNCAHDVNIVMNRPYMLVETASRSREYRVLSSILGHPPPIAAARWTPPPSPWVKVNVDTGYSGPTQKAISGIIVRDELGKQFHTWVNTIFMVEAMVVLHRLQFA
ncbi:hypothetical protein Gogos_018403 [Gossypium gossypioides]|uniref:RNase H type-1 domain-containing protein n=1 Tax=Gossypium gossypioides TaxID=34282 RepID=A0A7J9BF71_GOSGO|nr:hypothetical protein [Gossypium gossypioides]